LLKSWFSGIGWGHNKGKICLYRENLSKTSQELLSKKSSISYCRFQTQFRIKFLGIRWGHNRENYNLHAFLKKKSSRTTEPEMFKVIHGSC
jgi:hypothetical protein